MFRLDSKNLLRFSDTKIVTEKQRSGEELKFSKDNKKRSVFGCNICKYSVTGGFEKFIIINVIDTYYVYAVIILGYLIGERKPGLKEVLSDTTVAQLVRAPP